MKTKFSVILTLLLALVVQISFAQNQNVSGTVSDENGLPLPGATVVVEGTTTGVSTDFDGNYSIQANQGDVLLFSYVGYSTQSQAVGASNTINVSIQLLVLFYRSNLLLIYLLAYHQTYLHRSPMSLQVGKLR